jgi:hypothetical protein
MLHPIFSTPHLRLSSAQFLLDDLLVKHPNPFQVTQVSLKKLQIEMTILITYHVTLDKEKR